MGWASKRHDLLGSLANGLANEIKKTAITFGEYLDRCLSAETGVPGSRKPSDGCPAELRVAEQRALSSST